MKDPTDEQNQVLLRPLIPDLAKDEESPQFNEPWQAQVFALAVSLSEAGLFSWQEWTDELSFTILKAQEFGDPDLGSTYYQHWLKTLERMLTSKEVLDQTSILQRKKIWEEAYLRTPHGQPIKIKIT